MSTIKRQFGASSHPHLLILISTSTPNPLSTIPDTRLTHRSRARSNRPRSRLAPLLSSSHHSAEPANTPSTSTAPDHASPLAPTPAPARIAANERIVIGLVRVSRSVETYAPSSVLPPAVATCAAGAAR